MLWPPTLLYSLYPSTRRTTADQELLALIAPLAKLGRFEAAADFFQAYVLQLAF